MRFQSSADVAAGGVLLAIGAVVLFGSMRIYVPPYLTDLLGPRAFPLALGVLILAIAAYTLLAGLRHRGSALSIGDARILAWLVGASVAYLAIVRPAGYLVSTALYLFCLTVYLGERRLWAAALAAAGVSAALYVAFGWYLNVWLPVGPLGF